jgi:hypothetical protein
MGWLDDHLWEFTIGRQRFGLPMGEDWCTEPRIEPGIGYPCYVAGEGNAPPEDCGGIPGFYETRDIAAGPRHPEHTEICEWLDDYDPNVIDEAQIKISVARIAKRRNAANARTRK